MRFRVTVPVYVECNEIGIVVDHDGVPPLDEDAHFEIFEKAIQKAIMERPLVPWLIEERSVIYESSGEISRLIQSIDD